MNKRDRNNDVLLTWEVWKKRGSTAVHLPIPACLKGEMVICVVCNEAFCNERNSSS